MPPIAARPISASANNQPHFPPPTSGCRVTSRLLPLCLLAMLLAAQTGFAGDAPWLEVRSEHFRVITDAGEKSGREVATNFEKMRAAYGLLFGREKINENVPLQIIAFRNTEEFRQYSPIFRGKVVELTGFCIAATDENFVAIDMSRHNSWETVMHEYAHVLLNANYTVTAPWYDEGFAEFFSSMKIGDTNVIIGAVIPGAGALIQGRKLNMQQLLEVQHHSETYNQSGETRDMFYLQSWLFVHYLFDTEQVSKAGQYFILTNNKRVPVPQAVQTAFGMSVDQLNEALFAYLRTNKLRIIRYNFKQQIVTATQATTRPLDPLEVRTQLADLHLHEQDYTEQAVKELVAIVAENPNQAEAQRVLGYAYLYKHDLPKATEHLQVAAHLGSKDPRVYFYTAELLNEQNPASIGSPEVTKNLQRAIELDPQYADAYGMFGVALMNKGFYAQAETNLARAMTLSPRNEVYRLNYAFALLNQRKIAEAKTSLSYVAHSSNPKIAAQANQLLLQVQQYENQTSAGAPVEHRTVPHPPAESASIDVPATRVPPALVSYMTGVLVQANCAAPPSAVLTVASGGKTWKMKVADTEKVVVIGADKFSCSWSRIKVAINFNPTAPTEGNVITLEIQ